MTLLKGNPPVECKCRETYKYILQEGFFMEMESYAKKGVAGTALGLSIGSLGWQALNNGVLGNVLGGNRCRQPRV